MKKVSRRTLSTAKFREANHCVFPGGKLQERKENFAGFYVIEGKGFFDRIYDVIDPLEANMNLIIV